jgi:energy-converting hydrogenase Eha subunit C
MNALAVPQKQNVVARAFANIISVFVCQVTPAKTVQKRRNVQKIAQEMVSAKMVVAIAAHHFVDLIATRRMRAQMGALNVVYV